MHPSFDRDAHGGHGDPSEFSDPESSLVVDDPTGVDSSLVGERFGNYLLVAELAVGGMAEVFLAVHEGPEGFHKVVVVKRVQPRLGRSPELARMFLAEARVCARLEHPNIVRTTELGEARGQYFTVMEYLAGEDLRCVLARAARQHARIGVELVAAIMAQVCAGLHCAHELTDSDGRGLGLVHRDVTPANIIVTFGGEVKLIDFGVVKLAHREPETLAGTLKGKLAYMSPEQLRSHAVDRRSDVFAAGIVLWELLAGVPLFARETDAATLFAVASDPVPPLRALRAEVPEALVAIAERALARDPAQRFATAEDMQLALDGFLASDAARSTMPEATRESPARGLSRLLYQLFGERYGDAKRAISQSRSLAHNVALLGQLRDRSGADRARSAVDLTPARPPVRASRGPRLAAAAVVAVLAGGAGGLGYMILQHDGVASSPPAAAVASASLALRSTPSGATIYVAGDPTGMTTPAILSRLKGGDLVIRLEMEGYRAAEQVIRLAPGARLEQAVVLARVMVGPLSVEHLPPQARIIVDGVDRGRERGIALPAGRHVVRVVLAGKELAVQTIETGDNAQQWVLRDTHLVRQR
ncbi:MAG: serine/threonine-protein kinase [Kofleriaceae bacterium]